MAQLSCVLQASTHTFLNSLLLIASHYYLEETSLLLQLKLTLNSVLKQPLNNLGIFGTFYVYCVIGLCFLVIQLYKDFT